MPIRDYGVWKAHPLQWDGKAKPDHGHITFSDGVNNHLDAAVNVMSKTAETRLVYWLLRDFNKTHPIAKQLADLSFGFHEQKGRLSLGLDFLRDNFLNINDGILVSHNAPGSGSDILDYLDPILNHAVKSKATIYLYGQKFGGGSGGGTHDIHMNQGNSGSFAKDNGIFQDGGMIIEFPDGHWEAIFLAFAVQAYQTDDRGQPTTDRTFGDLLGGKPPTPPPTDDDIHPGDGDEGPSTDGPGPAEPPSKAITIQAALVNPIGPDSEPTSGDGETVFLLNTSSESISLDGWTISNASNQTQTLPAGSDIAANSKRKFAVPGCPLSNKGGRIILRNPAGEEADEVRYSKEQAAREGLLIYFRQSA